MIFDFDGLMVDTESSAYNSWGEIYREHGCTLPLERWEQVLGGSGSEFDPCAYLAELTGQTFDHDALRSRRLHRKLALVARERLLPGVRDAIDYAKEHGLKLGVASSSSRAWVLSHLERLEVTPLFNAVVCADDVARVKPAPDLYQAAAAKLGVLPHEAVAIEDSLNGLYAAKAAGLGCVAVPNKFLAHRDFSRADVRLASLAEVPFGQLLTTVAEAPTRSARRPRGA